MNRKEAIKILEHSGDYVGLLPSEFWNSDDGICEAIDMAIEALQDEWIPVSERLPEKYESVLVTVWNDVVIAWRNQYGGWESAEDMYGKGNVTAWKPLPAPYMGGDTE